MGAAYAAISADGRSIAFSSNSTDLLPPGGDANGSVGDIYVFERDPDGNGIFDEGNERIVLVSVHTDGTQNDQHCYVPDISGDGRFVTFSSNSSNLVSGTGSGIVHIFVHDRDPDGNGVYDEGNGVTTCASVNSLGEFGQGESREPHISTDGSSIVFRSLAQNLTMRDAGPYWQVYRHDQTTGQTIMASTDVTGKAGSQNSGIHGGFHQMTVNGDGSRVGFISYADDLVPFDPRPAGPDHFIMEPCPDPALDLGYGIPGTNGRIPELTICETHPGELAYKLRDLPPGEDVALLLSWHAANRPFHGSVLVPGVARNGPAIAPFTVVWLTADASGNAAHVARGGFRPNYAQAIADDPGSPVGLALSNALRILP